MQYRKAIWSGLSWVVVELDDLDPKQPLGLSFTSSEKKALQLQGQVYFINDQ